MLFEIVVWLQILTDVPKLSDLILESAQPTGSRWLFLHVVFSVREL